MKKYKHWVGFSIMDIETVKDFLKRGNNFSILNIYPSQCRPFIYVLEIESTDNYDNLDLNVNDGYNILHRFGRKPLLEKSVIDNFIKIYGIIPKMINGKNN